MNQETKQTRLRASWLEIDRQALINNMSALRTRLQPTTELMAVVKGNGYGHGATIVANAAQDAGADRLAVATVGEGIALRQDGITLPILVLGHTPLSAVAEALQHELTLTLHTDALPSSYLPTVDLHTTDEQDSLSAVAEIAMAASRTAKIHVKVNTGMNRLGFPADVVAKFLRRAQQYHGTLVVEGIFTHFATADAPDQEFLHQQLAQFQELLQELETNGLRPSLAHAANSAATLQAPKAHLDLVRCGIALYGLHPDAETCRLPHHFQPALCWKAMVVQLTALQPGDSVSYGRTFRASKPMTVATIPIGYADGFPRTPHNWGTVLLHGEMVPIVGRVCMDQCVVDVSALLDRNIRIQPGDEVVLIGTQGNRSLTAEEIGRRTGTINYEVVSRILARVPRFVV